jgi:hypothetical protein
MTPAMQVLQETTLLTSLMMLTWQQLLQTTAAATLKQTCLAALRTSLGPAATQQQQCTVLAPQQTVQQQETQTTIYLPVSWVCLMMVTGMGMPMSSQVQAGTLAALQAVQTGCCPTHGASAAPAAPAAQQLLLPALAAPAGMPAAPAGTAAAQRQQQRQQPHSLLLYRLATGGLDGAQACGRCKQYLQAGCVPGVLWVMQRCLGPRRLACAIRAACCLTQLLRRTRTGSLRRCWCYWAGTGLPGGCCRAAGRLVTLLVMLLMLLDSPVIQQ